MEAMTVEAVQRRANEIADRLMGMINEVNSIQYDPKVNSIQYVPEYGSTIKPVDASLHASFVTSIASLYADRFAIVGEQEGVQPELQSQVKPEVQEHQEGQAQAESY